MSATNQDFFSASTASVHLVPAQEIAWPSLGVSPDVMPEIVGFVAMSGARGISFVARTLSSPFLFIPVTSHSKNWPASAWVTTMFGVLCPEMREGEVH
ncbi:unannotated protein [freshwater metagenome]|uniref:Unannotated protein n=1 Tax=freshwater metagenome TaxID=449393 RepID=A0A6J7SNB0_9ZZZZ